MRAFCLSLFLFTAPLLCHAQSDPDLNRKLNDFNEWDLRHGEWKVDDSKRIVGNGDSSLVSKVMLPADGDFSYTMTVLMGMRARVAFEGTGIMIGNEGWAYAIEAHGGATRRHVKFQYKFDQPMRITLKFRGPNFEMYIDNELYSRGTRKTTPELTRFRLSAGDGWSKGIVAFSNFEYTPVKKEKP